MKENYLIGVIKQFEYYKNLTDKSLVNLSSEDFLWANNTSSNSIAIIICHLYGNMKSRWTNFLVSDGEKPWRNRDEEFEVKNLNKDELLLLWEEGWKCLFDALDSITNDNFDTKILIRNQTHTVIEAINRQMMHYAYHIGQIVFISKMIQDKTWDNLSIPKGSSDHYNANKFSKGRHGGHFTDNSN